VPAAEDAGIAVIKNAKAASEAANINQRAKVEPRRFGSSDRMIRLSSDRTVPVPLQFD
jgi:hypothetical protein